MSWWFQLSYLLPLLVAVRFSFHPMVALLTETADSSWWQIAPHSSQCGLHVPRTDKTSGKSVDTFRGAVLNRLTKKLFFFLSNICAGVRESLQKIISSSDDTLPYFGPRSGGSSVSLFFTTGQNSIYYSFIWCGVVIQVNSSGQVCTSPFPVNTEKRECMDLMSTGIMALEK